MEHFSLTELGLVGFELTQTTNGIAGVRYATLSEVLVKLKEIKATDIETATLKHKAIHIVPCPTEQDPELVAVVAYNEIDEYIESNSYIVSLMDLKDIDWEEVKAGNYFYWTTHK